VYPTSYFYRRGGSALPSYYEKFGSFFISAAIDRTIKWREGATDWLSSRFARVHVRVAHRDYSLTDSRREEWLLIEWPKGENEPTKYWLSTLPKDISFRRLVELSSCAGASSAIIRNSSRGSGSDILKGVGGEAFIITQRSASQPTDS
jgi:hypothetical protein